MYISLHHYHHVPSTCSNPLDTIRQIVCNVAFRLIYTENASLIHTFTSNTPPHFSK